jgi:hypothetical protein
MLFRLLPGDNKWEKLGSSTATEIQTKYFSNMPTEQPPSYDHEVGWIREEQKSGF